LSDEVVAGAGTAAGVDAAGVLDGVLEELDDVSEEGLEADLSELSEFEEPEASELEDLGLALPYPSAYQPPPLKEMAGAERTRSMCPPQ
jgi:hypothetical protein